MATIKINATIVEIGQTKQVTETFRKREFVILEKNDRDERFNNYYLAELMNDRCSQLDNFAVGQQVTVSIDLRGRVYDKKDGSGKGYITSLSAFLIQPVQTQPVQTPTASQLEGAKKSHGSYEQLQPAPDLPF